MQRQPLNRFTETSDDRVAYHYYRSLGWVPKPGSKMGVDLAIYYLGPRYTHAPFGILIVPVDAADKAEVQASPDSFLHLRWHKLGALFRVIHGAAKELMCAFVVQPPASVDLSNPDSLQHFRVQELIVDRWVPKEDRDAGTEVHLD
jgi:tRNA-splicing endonuclease subunit Sen2